MSSFCSCGKEVTLSVVDLIIADGALIDSLCDQHDLPTKGNLKQRVALLADHFGFTHPNSSSNVNSNFSSSHPVMDVIMDRIDQLTAKVENLSLASVKPEPSVPALVDFAPPVADPPISRTVPGANPPGSAAFLTSGLGASRPAVPVDLSVQGTKFVPFEYDSMDEFNRSVTALLYDRSLKGQKATLKTLKSITLKSPESFTEWARVVCAFLREADPEMGYHLVAFMYSVSLMCRLYPDWQRFEAPYIRAFNKEIARRNLPGFSGWPKHDFCWDQDLFGMTVSPLLQTSKFVRSSGAVKGENNNARDRSQDVCYHCKKKGHWFDDCPDRADDGTAQNPVIVDPASPAPKKITKGKPTTPASQK